MKLSEFKNFLRLHPDKPLHFVLPTGTKIPIHAHVTDVARVDKRFIDCGGTVRSESVCRLQTWFSDDTEHRLSARTLSKVLEKAAPVLGEDNLELDVEHEAPFISQFPISKIEAPDSAILVQLDVRHTTCLAQDICLPKKGSELLKQYKGLPTLETGRCC